MIKKITLIVVFITILLRGGYAQDILRVSLDDAISYAYKNSTAIQRGKMNINDADLQIKQSKASGLPKVDAEVNLQHFLIQPGLPSSALGFGAGIGESFTPIYQGLWAAQDKIGLARTLPPAPAAGAQEAKVKFQLKNNFNGGVTVSQLLFSGSYLVALRAARDYRSLVDLQLEKKKDSLRNAVVDAYLPTLLLDEGIKTFDKNIKNLEKTFTEVKATHKAGFIEQLDVDRLEFSINNLKAQRDNLMRQREVPLNVLKLTIGYPIEKGLELTDDINSLTKSLADVDINAPINYANYFEIKELEATEKLLAINVDLQKALALPTVAAFGSLSYGFQGNKLNSMFGVPTSLIGLKASYNIWDNNERKIKEERALLALEQFRSIKTDVKKFIDFGVANARISINNAQKNLENQQKNLTLAQRIYDVTQKKYKEGVGSSLELTTAERDIYQAQQNVRQAQYDLLVAKKVLIKAFGN
jgi:outer membrane protein